MRIALLIGAALVALLLAAPVGSAGSTRVLMPLVAREVPPTPVPTPTPAAVHIQYRTFVQDEGWQPWQDENGVAGTVGKSIRALEMRIVSGPPGVRIKYRSHISNVGWQPDYIFDGGTSGSENGSTIEAVQVGLVNAPPNTYISIEPSIQDWGWSGYVRDFWQAGTTGQGRRLEQIRAYVRVGSPEPARIGIGVNANPRGMGYLGWKKDGELAGTTGKVLPLDTFRVATFNKPEGMRIQYRCYVQDNEWQPWQDEGGECGLFGTNKAIYSFEMKLFDSWAGTILTYTGHFQNKGDLTWSSDDPGTNVNGTLGTPQEKFQLEALRASFRNP
jgi:uncharacterized protein YjdB